MPALVLYGHRTRLAGDDLRINCIFVVLFRLAQVFVLIPLLVFRSRIDDTAELIKCRVEENEFANLKKDGGVVFVIYWILAVFLVVLSLLVEAVIWKISGQGSPTQPEKRQKLIPLCKIKLIPIGIIRVTLFTLGIIILTVVENVCNCLQEDEALFRRTLIEFKEECDVYDKFYLCLAILVFTQLLDLCFAGLIATCFLFGSVRPRQRIGSLLGHCFSVDRQMTWKLTCQFCCTCSSVLTCCLLGGKESGTGDFADISMVLADYFADGGLLDITVSDIIAGIVMLSRSHEERRIEAREEIRQAEQRENACSAEMGSEQGTERRRPRRESDDLHGEKKVECYVDVENAEEGNATAELKDEISDMPKDKQQDKGTNRRGSLAYVAERNGSILAYSSVMRDMLSKENAHDKLAIAEGARYISVSVAIYAWMMYLRNHPCTAHCTVVGACVTDVSRCSDHRCCKPKQNIIGDNCCGWNETALLKEGGLDKSDIAYAQFRVGFAVTPYCIAIDHDWKSIVVAIRGTLSFDDVAVDISIRPKPLDEVGGRCGFDGRGEFCHDGILACAEWIYSDLQSHGILDKLLLADASEYTGYRLRVVGHSLGAGVAALLSVMLRSKFPNLRCICFEPPGCVLSIGAAQQCKSYLTSFVHDMDIIPRMSLESMENFRNDVLEMIARIKVPKHEVFEAGLRYRGMNVSECNQELLHQRESIPPSEFSRQFAEFKELQQQRKRDRDMEDIPMYPPGKIVYLTRVSERKSCMKGLSSKPDQYLAQWAMSGDFTEIMLSSHMIDDHDGVNVRSSLEQLASSFGLAPPYTTNEALNS